MREGKCRRPGNCKAGGKVGGGQKKEHSILDASIEGTGIKRHEP